VQALEQHHKQQQQVEQQQQQQQSVHWQHQVRLQQQQQMLWLSAQISAAASWQEVSGLLDQHETLYTPLHYVMLVGRLDALLVTHPGAAAPAARHEQQEYVDLVQTLVGGSSGGGWLVIDSYV
jgi:alanyl-tRNA synthetase